MLNAFSICSNTRRRESTNDIIQLFSQIQCPLLWMCLQIEMKVKKKTYFTWVFDYKNKKIQSFEPWKMVWPNWEKTRQLFNRLYEFEDFQLNCCPYRCTNSIALISFHSEWISLLSTGILSIYKWNRKVLECREDFLMATNSRKCYRIGHLSVEANWFRIFQS